MEVYTTAHAIQMFGVTHQTIKNWSREFASYLSPSATPEQGKKRLFTLEDVKVFALVMEYHKRGLGYEDAHIALRSGQRGDVPQATDITATIPPSLLITLREEITSLRTQLKVTEQDRDKERGKTELLEKQLAEKEGQMKELYKEIAHLEADRPKEEKDR